MSEFKCPRGNEPCNQVGCGCRTEYLKERLRNSPPGTATKVLSNLVAFAQGDPETLSDEEIDYELRMAGIDPEELSRRTLSKIADIKAKMDRGEGAN